MVSFTEQRDARIPNVPTAKELGYDVTGVPAVSGIVGPPGMPADKVGVIEAAMARLPNDPKYMEWANKRGMMVKSVPSSQFKKVAGQYYELVKKYKHLFK